jgi:glycolate oxidase iron-sulfur subunit
VDIGRKWAEEKTAPRPSSERITRWLLKEGLTSPTLFNTAMAVGRVVRPLMPAALQRKIPQGLPAGQRPQRHHARKMLILEGCVQPGMLPNINHATVRVLDALGIELISSSKVGCCGALRYHLNDQDGGLTDAKRNIDAWWPSIENGKDSVEAIVMNASGCGVMVKDYGHLLHDDPLYASKAKRVSELCNLKLERIDIHEKLLKEVGGKGNKDRIVVLSDRWINAYVDFAKKFFKINNITKVFIGTIQSICSAYCLKEIMVSQFII